MLSSSKLLLHLLLLITSLQKAQSQNCLFEDVSDNAAIIDNDVFCFKVPEAVDTGSAACVFRIRNAASVQFNTFNEVGDYNRLDVQDNGDNTITVSLVQTDSYTGILDTANPPTASTFVDQLRCVSSGSSYVYQHIYVDVDEGNTQTPRFRGFSYSYYDVPENWPPGVYLSIEQFGTPILAEDRDNTFGNFESPEAEIIFKLQGLGSEDFEVSTAKNSTTWPYTYRALISSKKPFDYRVNTRHQFLITAKNADGKRESTVAVTLFLKDYDNLDPSFASSYYLTSVDETMITTPGTYPLKCTPEIAAYDQDIGINQTLTYSINTDCGETSFCSILKTHFVINNITGALSFVSNGEWPYQTTEISFLILASQVDNPDKIGHAEVIATFQLPGKVVSGYAH